MSGTSSPIRKFGGWYVKENNTVYQALTDGAVHALGQGLTTLSGLTNINNPPTIERFIFYESGGGYSVSGMMDVKKGDYWKVTGAITVYWLPES